MAHYHFHGGTGMGKSTHLKHHVATCLAAGHGLLYLDPHGEDATDLLDTIAQERLKQTLLYDPTEFPLAFNMLAGVHPDNRTLVAHAAYDTIKTLAGYNETTTPRIFNNVYFPLYALMQYGGTLADLPKMLLDKDYRTTVLDSLTDTFHKTIYWEHFNSYRAGKELNDNIDSTLSQFYALLGDERIRRSIGQKTSSFSVADILENNGVFIARLPKGWIGENQTKLLGSFILSQFHVQALRRKSRTPFWIFADEGHHWSPTILREILTGSRKFGINLVVTSQTKDQLDHRLWSTLAGNCEERHVFRVSQNDAEEFERDRTRYDHRLNLYELPPYTYRSFSFASDPEDRRVVPFNPVRHPDSRRYIEESMRRNYVRPLPHDG